MMQEEEIAQDQPILKAFKKEKEVVEPKQRKPIDDSAGLSSIFLFLVRKEEQMRKKRNMQHMLLK